MVIEKSVLSEKIGRLRKLLPSKVTPEVLAGLLVDCDTITAFGGDVGATSKIETDSYDTFILPLRALELIPQLPGDEITFLSHAKELQICAGEAQSKFALLDPNAFPKFPEVEGESVTIEADTLIGALGRVIHAASDEESGKSNRGVFFHTEDDMLHLVSCDGYRLSWIKLDYSAPMKFILPKTTAKKLLGFGLEDEIKLTCGETSVEFESHDYTFYSRLLQGEYFDYQKVIPNHDHETSINRRQLIEAIVRCDVCCGSAKKMLMQFERNALFTSVSGEEGAYNESLPINSNSSEPVELIMRIPYLLEALRAFTADEITIKFKGPVDPLIFEAENQLELVLPMRRGA